MTQAAFDALGIVLSAQHLLYLLFGVVVGLVVGVLPGLGGIVGMALLLPFVYGLDPIVGLSMLVGVAAVVTTSDTFPAVLLGIPGSSGSQATIMDGFPLAKNGEAARALSAAFMASMIGGLIGAVFLTLIIPVARPLVLAFGSPELLAMTILGLCMVGVLSGSRPLLGILMAVFGLLLGTVGAAPVAPTYRYAFGYDYLFDGFPLVVVSLGLFAIPEILDVLAKGGAIAGRGKALGAGWMTGMRDIFTHRWLVIRHSVMGVGIGMVPGLGSAIVDWLNYGYLVQTAKDKSRFGKGDIRGVIAPESANNAKEGGALIPTLLFGVPGSASMAILLGAMVVLGVEPGPRILDTNLTLIFVLIWSLAIANVVGTIICLGFSRPIAALTRIPFPVLFPLVFLLITLGAYQATRHVGDLVVLIGFGILGWIMKKVGAPRAPLLVGFILSTLAERYVWVTVSRFGMDWLARPGVITILLLTVVLVGLSIRGMRPSRGDGK